MLQLAAGGMLTAAPCIAAVDCRLHIASIETSGRCNVHPAVVNIGWATGPRWQLTCTMPAMWTPHGQCSTGTKIRHDFVGLVTPSHLIADNSTGSNNARHVGTP